jgi:hypothetical protein
MLAQLNEPNVHLGKNWLSRFLDRHPDLKIARNRGLDSKRITAVIPSQIEGWFTHVDDVVQRFNIHPRIGGTWMRLVTNSAIARTSSLYSIDTQELLYHWQVV